MPSPPPNRFESALAAGDHDAGHSFSPSAIRVACHRSRVLTMPAIMARIRSASPMWLPSNRAGRCTLRMKNAAHTLSSTSTANRSTRNANQPWWPSQGSVASRSTAAIMAMMMVGNSTMKPQKISACITPRAQPLQQLALPDRDDRLLAHPLRHVVEPGRGLAQAHDPDEQPGAPGEDAAGHRQRRQQRDQGDGLYPAPAFRSSAVIAGITSCRSPITA